MKQSADVTFDELFDLDEIQAIQDSFAKATGVASIITTVDGLPITRPSNFCRLCRDIIRKTKTGLKNCMKSDAKIGRYNPEGPIVKPCLSGGLWDAGASINLNGTHVANWLIGQVRNEKIDTLKILNYADIIGADFDEFKDALDEVTVMSLEQFKHIGQSLFLIANQLSVQAYQRLHLNRAISYNRSVKDSLDKRNTELKQTVNLLRQEIQQKKTVQKELTKKNEYMEALHETALGMFSRIDITQVLDSIIHRASHLTRIPNGFLYIYDQKNRALELKAACGQYSEFKGILVDEGEGIAGKVWEQGEAISIEDYQAWSGKSHQSEFDFVTSTIGVPLTSGTKIEGAIGLSHHEKGKQIYFEDLEVLKQFAELATIAIDNAKLFDSLKNELDKRIQLENERIQMETRIRQSQKMEAIGTLAGGIAHDFNNILFPIIGFSQMIMHDLPRNSPIIKQLEPVITGAERAKELVQQILTFSREVEIEYQPVKISVIVKEALKLARASLPSTITIVKDIPKNLRMVMADPTQIHQIVLNLITNALHAMEEYGGEMNIMLKEISISGENLEDPNLKPGEYICMTVKDTGCGMDPETVKRVFEPYFTTKDRTKGTGLGLSVVYGIVKNLNGHITVQSEKHKGSQFALYLPIIVEKGAVDENVVLSNTRQNGNERILLIDDEITILNMIKQVLTRFGYRVTAYERAAEALRLFEASPEEFDLIITDLTMPGLTGDILAARIKKIRPELPIVLCTGFSEKMVTGKLNHMMPDKILMKPVSNEELINTIRCLCDHGKC